MFMTFDFPGVFVIFTGVKLLIAYPYFAFLESSRWQGTLGKLALGIKVTSVEGERISFARATGRYFLKSVSAFLFMLGYLISFSDRRQTWHDYIARTQVLRKNVFPQYYAMPRISARWIFDVPLFTRWRVFDEKVASYECLFCDYRGEKHVGCPRCGHFGYAPIMALQGALLMAGIIFTLTGSWLGYLTWWVIDNRLLDDRLGREGTPWGVIFIIFVGFVVCLGGGVMSILEKKWFMGWVVRIALGLSGASLRLKA